MIEKYKYVSTDKMITLVILALISALLGLVMPFSILIIFDRVVPNQAMTTLWFLYLIIVAAIVFDTKLGMIEEKFTSAITKAFEKDMTEQVFRAICLADIARFNKFGIGEYLERIRTIPALRSYYGGDAVKVIINAISCIIIFAIIAVINWKSGAVLVGASLFLYALSQHLSKEKVKRLEGKVTLEDTTNSKIIEIVSNPLNLKTASMEYRMENFMDQAIDAREDRSVELEKLEANFPLAIDLTQQVSLAGVVIACAISVIHQEMSQGGMAAIILLTNRYFAPYRQIMSTFTQWKVNKLQLSRLNDLIALEQKDICDNTINSAKIIVRGEGAYHFKRGHIYVISGGSCCGKTHLMKAIALDKVDPTLAISVDNTPIGDINYNAWKNAIVNVDANSSFIEGTIIENITCFRPKLYKAAYALCEAMGIKTIIDTLPRGFYTQLKGTKNYPFSRQVEFALFVIRALLCRKSVLIVDDIDLVYDTAFAQNLLRCIESRGDAMTVFLVSNKIKVHTSKIIPVPISRIMGSSPTLIQKDATKNIEVRV